jgi:ParB/RepB/Spo0J family partition protein
MSAIKAIHDIAIDLIDIDPQVRRICDETKVSELASSIKSEGQLVPVLIRRVGDRFKLVFGERRLRATKSLGKATISVITVDEELSASSITIKQLVENMQRESLNPIDESLAINQLMRSMNWSAGETCSRLGIKPAALTRSLSLLKLDDSFQRAVASGQIPASAGYELSKIEDPVKQRDLAEQYICGKLTRDGLGGVVKAIKKRLVVSVAEPSVRRATAVLSPGVAVTIAAANLTVDRAIEIAEEFLAKLRKARQSGISLSTALAMLKDQAKT